MKKPGNYPVPKRVRDLDPPTLRYVAAYHAKLARDSGLADSYNHQQADYWNARADNCSAIKERERGS